MTASAATACTLIVGGIGQLVTGHAADGEPHVVADAVLAASGERIVFCGSAAEWTAAGLPRSPRCVEVDAGGAAVVPGFVDAHTHLAWLGDRGEEYALRAAGATYEEIAERGGGIRSTVRATAAGSVGELTAATAARARRMLRHGTTTVEIKSGYGLALDAEIRQLTAAQGIVAGGDVPDVVTTYLPLHAAPPGDRAAFLAAVNDDGLAAAAPFATAVDAFCETGAYTAAECEAFLTAAARRGLRGHLHAEQRTHSGGARVAARCGALSADHLEHADDGDLGALAEAGVAAVLLPGATLVLGGPPPPGRRALEAGCTVAIATDCNPGTCYSESMPLMLSLAVATAGLTPAQALRAATAGGARALGLTDRGALRPGLRCDAVVVQSERWVDLAYHLGGEVVATVVRAGRVVAGGGVTEGS